MENCTACYIERSPSFARLSLHAVREDPFASYGYSFFSFTPGRQNRPSIDTLPVYMESEALPPPSYAVRDEPVTFAMYLFIIGFRTSHFSTSAIKSISDIPHSNFPVLDPGRLYLFLASTYSILVRRGGRMDARQDHRREAGYHRQN